MIFLIHLMLSLLQGLVLFVKQAIGLSVTGVLSGGISSYGGDKDT